MGRNDFEIDIDFLVISVISCSVLDIPNAALTKNSNWFSDTHINSSVERSNMS